MTFRSVAAAQTIPVRGDVDANLAQHLHVLRVAAEARAQVVVFPELSLTGYELGCAETLAFSEHDGRLAPLLDAASMHAITIVVGAPVRIGPRLYIGAFIISPNRATSLYTKHHPGAFSSSASVDGIVPPAEATVFQPGSANPIVLFGGNTAAVAVCADTGRPLHAQRAAERGAHTYLASMFIIPSEFARETTALERYARQHSMAVVLANYGGPSGGLAAAGRSTIWSERGELLAQLEPHGAGVVIATESVSGWHARAIMLDDH